MPARRVNGEGSKPFQRPGRRGWYSHVGVTDPHTGAYRRVLLSAPTKTELATKVRKALATAATGEPTVAGRRTTTVAAYAQRWCEEHLAARDVTPGTRRLYRHAVNNYIVPVLGDLLLDRVRVRDAEKVDARLQQMGRSRATRRLAYNVLRMLFDTAVRDRLVAVNPASGLSRPADPPSMQAHYGMAQLRTLLAAVTGQRVFEQMVPLMLWTAMRPGEALALRWDQVDLEARLLWVNATLAVDERGRVHRQEFPKSKRARPVPLVPAAVAVLRSARAAQAQDRLAVGEAWVDAGLVFADPLGGLLDDRNLRRRYAPLVEAAGLSGSFHALRRSTATMLTGVGVPLPIVAQILGHSSTLVTQAHYTVVDTTMMATALAALEQHLSAPPA